MGQFNIYCSVLYNEHMYIEENIWFQYYINDFVNLSRRQFSWSTLYFEKENSNDYVSQMDICIEPKTLNKNIPSMVMSNIR